MHRQHKEQHGLEAQYQAVQRQIQEHSAREYDSVRLATQYKGSLLIELYF